MMSKEVKTFAHSILITSKDQSHRLLNPRTPRRMHYSHRDLFDFRINKAEQVDGIDYSNFNLLGVFVGCCRELRWPFVPFVDVFKRIPSWNDKGYLTLRAGVDLLLIVVNVGDHTAPFAITLSGEGRT